MSMQSDLLATAVLASGARRQLREWAGETHTSVEPLRSERMSARSSRAKGTGTGEKLPHSFADQLAPSWSTLGWL